MKTNFYHPEGPTALKDLSCFLRGVPEIQRNNKTPLLRFSAFLKHRAHKAHGGKERFAPSVFFVVKI